MSRDIKVLNMIIKNMEQDVIDADGKPFTGKTLAELQGNLCATIQALANIMKKHLEEEEQVNE